MSPNVWVLLSAKRRVRHLAVWTRNGVGPMCRSYAEFPFFERHDEAEDHPPICRRCHQEAVDYFVVASDIGSRPESGQS